jgi:hypothetical protein
LAASFIVAAQAQRAEIDPVANRENYNNLQKVAHSGRVSESGVVH